MLYKYLSSIAGGLAMCGFAMLAAGSALAQTAKVAATTAKSWTQPKTPWGDPDLQGTWTSDDCIGAGLNRNPNFGDRLYYTEDELAQTEKRIERQEQTDLQETVAADQRVGTGPPGHWGERARRPCRQTSLVMDPPNGHVPDMTADARLRPIP